MHRLVIALVLAVGACDANPFPADGVQYYLPDQAKDQIDPRGACAKLPCKFNDSQACGYELSPSGSDHFTHSSSSGAPPSVSSATNLVPSSATGSTADADGKPGGGYVVAKGPSSKACLRSQKFIADFNGKFRFKYFYFSPSGGSCIFRVCLDSGNDCKDITAQGGLSKTWQQAETNLKPVEHTISICALNLSVGSEAAVDNIQVVKPRGEICDGK